ncbi:MAG TPA: alpha-ketoglutarate-dependent dioxygenase AlkB [Gemmatimonadales bacterium]|nr:alpha-ketoglutarate-dependent dioxygenase AlkB [Gemmatimonadales bacterium]
MSREAMEAQAELFGGGRRWPEGFRYGTGILPEPDERALIPLLKELPFQAFDFHGYTGKRRVVSFGWRHDFDREAVRQTQEIPQFLVDLRERAAAFAGLDPGRFEQVLVTEYGPGAGIGWHRDKAAFGEVIGISLLSACVFRLRRKVGGRWERVSLLAEPRSAYLLSGASRTEWEHSIPTVGALRYSVTFRSLRPGGDG